MTWPAEEYDRQARELAQAFVAGEPVGGSPLTDLVEKTAREHALSPEQIRTLSRETNKAVFAAKYAATQGQHDRRVDWDVVDPEAVIARLQARELAPPVLKTASYPDLPDPRATSRVKTAAAPAPPPPDPALRAAHLRKLAADLPHDLGGLDVRWQTLLHEVVRVAEGTTHDHPAFEKNAVGVLGPEVVPELNAVRARLGYAPLDQVKIAEVRDRLLGIPDRLTDLLGEALAVRTTYAQTRAALDAVRREVTRG